MTDDITYPPGDQQTWHVEWLEPTGHPDAFGIETETVRAQSAAEAIIEARRHMPRQDLTIVAVFRDDHRRL